MVTIVHRRQLFAVVLPAFLALLPVVGEASPAPVESTEPSARDDASARLHALFEREWRERLADDPLLATSMGLRGEHDRRLPDDSLAALARRAQAAQALLDELATIDRSTLDAEDRLSADVFRWQLEQVVDAHAHHHGRLPLTSDTGFHVSFAQLPDQMPLRTAEDYQAYAARLRAFSGWVDDHVERLRAGVTSGMTLPRVTLASIDAALAAQLVDAPETSLFFAPFLAFPPTVAPEDRLSLETEGLAATRAAIEGHRRFLDFLRTEYAPAARESVGASSMNGGARYYAQRVRHFTTLDVSPEEVHRVGLDEVARIRAEMDAVIARVAARGEFRITDDPEADFERFVDWLRTDPRFYAETPQALLERASFLAKRIDGLLPHLVRRLPRLPYGVEPVPDHIAPYYTAGRYVPGSLDGSCAGTYWVNTHDLPSRPLYALEALTLHEAVPGHHLQISLAQELGDLPPFRRELYISAYGEGWALYTERLGVEVDFYTDDYAEFGRLTYEMWRACRLVVDTGLHAFGWSRERAIDYLASNTALSLREVETEIDRYISWPGQALAYKMGEITIRRLRAEAEDALGEGFDLRAFHDTILGTGSVPLPALERVVRRWIEETRHEEPAEGS